MRTSDACWEAVVARDPGADGEFVFGVVTTGIYCRPTCGARRPKRENATFHRDGAQARAAGMRPCLRCLPDLPPLKVRQAELIARLCRELEYSEELPTLRELSERAGLGTSHLHRLFKAVTGLTPKAWVTAQRARRTRVALQSSDSVTEAIYAAGFRSSGRFYEADSLGMTPSEFRSGGAGADIRFAVGDCSLGKILVGATARGVCAILLGDDERELKQDLARRFPSANLVRGDTRFVTLISRVVALVERPGTGLKLPLDLRGTAFEQRVWLALRKIPMGTTTT